MYMKQFRPVGADLVIIGTGWSSSLVCIYTIIVISTLTNVEMTRYSSGYDQRVEPKGVISSGG